MSCIKFEVLKSGKMFIEGKKLNLLKLIDRKSWLDDKYYLVSNGLLKVLQNYDGGKLKDYTAYTVVGKNVHGPKGGIVVKVEKSELGDTIKDIMRYQFIKINPKL